MEHKLGLAQSQLRGHVLYPRFERIKLHMDLQNSTLIQFAYMPTKHRKGLDSCSCFTIKVNLGRRV